MGIIFNSDGTTKRTSDEFDFQQFLKDTIQNYDQHLEGGFDELRTYRDDELKTSDWTQVPDGPLDSTTKAAWATYREKLRDLPGSAKAPFWFDESDWPLAPGQSSINPDALTFIKRNIDPLGIATTSWVGITTAMEDKGLVDVIGIPIGIGTDLIGIGNTEGIKVGDHLRNTNTGLGNTIPGTVIGIVAGITTISVSLASTTSSIINGDLILSRSGTTYYEQERPFFTLSVGAAATTVNSEGTIKFTINTTNQINSQDVRWRTTGVLCSPTAGAEGTVNLVPNSSYVGVSTVSITIPEVTAPNSDLTFIAETIGVYNESEVTVGVITA